MGGSVEMQFEFTADVRHKNLGQKSLECRAHLYIWDLKFGQKRRGRKMFLITVLDGKNQFPHFSKS